MKKTIYIVLCMCVVFLIGCATIVSKSKYPVNLTSEPTGANITILNGKGEIVFTGETPMEVTLNAGEGYYERADYKIVVEKEGYEKRIISLTSNIDPWYGMGNYVFGSLIGWLIIDPATGAMWKVMAEDINTELLKLEEGEDKTFGIMTIDELPQEYMKYLIRIEN